VVGRCLLLAAHWLALLLALLVLQRWVPLLGVLVALLCVAGSVERVRRRWRAMLVSRMSWGGEDEDGSGPGGLADEGMQSGLAGVCNAHHGAAHKLLP
jgi:hypothetical protein